MKREIFILFSILNSIQLGLAGINWQPGDGGVVWANGCDWADNHIGSKKIAPESCGGACLFTNGCTHFTWTNFNGGTCWFKGGSVKLSDAKPGDKSILCGVTPIGQINWQPGDGGVFWANACDWKDGNIGSAKVAPENCGNTCLRKSGCTHFTWTYYNGGTCWLKGGNIKLSDAKFTDDKSMLCGKTFGDQNIWQSGDGGVLWAHACYWENNDIGSAKAAPEDCGNTCLIKSGCTHFTWTYYNGGTCWLKGGDINLTDAKFTNDKSTLCGKAPSVKNGRLFY